MNDFRKYIRYVFTRRYGLSWFILFVTAVLIWFQVEILISILVLVAAAFFDDWAHHYF